MASTSKFTDIFIRRPVLATVISLLIFFVGLRAITDMQVREFPRMDNTVITVTTYYPGASASTVEGFITTPLEKDIAGAEGIDYMTSTSTDSTSTITAYIKLNFDPNAAFTNVMAKVAEAKSVLPKNAEDPVITKTTGSSTALMYVSFSSKDMSSQQITDYISRVVQPKLESIHGVAQAQVLGGKVFAMRVWLNSKKLAAFGVTPNDVYNALVNNNFQAAAGSTKGEYIAISINAKTDLQTVKGFQNLVVKQSKGALVRLKDVAKVKLGSEDYDSAVYFNGQKAVFVAINSTPTANPLDVIANVKKVLPDLKTLYPPTLHSKVVYDATKYIRSSIREVTRTIIEATIIVILVIFLFLGSLRTVFIPIVTIPLSLVGVCAAMLALGYSINLLTLLAMVLAIGMVVDDAIVVVENVYRHIEEGLAPIQAALQGAREIATPIISMTITLAAVYAPIGFMGGITGALFKEFAFTLAAAVIISGIIALTLSPMMCSKVLTADIGQNRLVHFIDTRFSNLKNRYERMLHGVLNYKVVMVFFAFVVLVSCIFLFTTSKSEMAPKEDQGVVFVFGSGPQSANIDYMQKFSNQFNKTYESLPSNEDYFTVDGYQGVNSVISATILKPWDERKQTAQQANVIIQKEFNKIAGLQLQAITPPALPTTGSPLPIQFVLTTIGPYSEIYSVMQKLVEEATKSGLFLFLDGDLKYNKPQLEIIINRSKASLLGINMQEIAQALSTSLGGNYVNWFTMEGRSYRVIPQVARKFRLNPSQLNLIYIRTLSGTNVPLSTVVSFKYKTEPNALTRFQQLNSTTLSGMMRPGHTLAEGLAFLQSHAKKIMPHNMTFNYAGQSRQFIEEGNALALTFVFSLIVIFLVLAAQFESFRDPLVIMISVPMAISGALLPINWGLATINIYTQIGIITLIGLISKHGILMVDFANKLREDDPELTRMQAITQAAAIRLRPVLMTTAAMILGVVPLITATGAGAHSRFDIGLVIASGMFIGTLFTLFVVPTMYTLKARSILFFLGFVGATGVILFHLLQLITL